MCVKGFVTEEARNVPILAECDVLVAGGGTAGVAAALAAARTGASTVVIEQLPYISGTMGNGGMMANAFWSSYTPEHPDCIQVVKGIPEEIYDRLIENGASPGYVHTDPKKCPYRRPVQSMQNREMYTAIVYRLLVAAGVRLYTHTFLSDVVMAGNAIKAVLVESKSGTQAILARQFIDCTGDADLAVAAGCEYTTDVYNSPWCGNIGFFFGMGNIDLVELHNYAAAHDMLKEPVARHPNKDSDEEDMVRIVVNLAKCPTIPEGAFLHGRGRMLVQSVHGHTAQCISVIGSSGVDAVEVDSLTDIELQMRGQALDAADCLRRYVPGFSNAYVNWLSNQVGIRQSRNVVCRYNVSWEDIRDSARFEDEIGMFGYQDLTPVDDAYLMLNKGYYGLPYRMLLPFGPDNLLTAGRLNTLEFVAHMSTRNTMCCMVQGQAAGTAAALCAQQDIPPHKLDYSTLRARLLQDNVYIEEPARAEG